MGCGSSVTQVADIGREGGFRPIHLLEMSEHEANIGQSKVYLFGQTRTQRRILECDMKSSSIKNISTRARIPFPKIHLDPIETMYQQSQEIFHLGIYGFSRQPPFNDMLTLFLQKNLLFMCGGKDYEGYNIKNDAFFYSIVPQPLKISSEMIHSSEMSQRTLEYKPKYPNNKFQKMASMNKARYSHTGIYCNNNKSKNIFVFGGINQKEQILESCQMYNIFENSWKEIPDMKKPRANAQCFQYGNKIYVFGGRSGKEKLSKKIETLDLDSLQWMTLNFKLHRGIEDAMLFSQHPNQILIVGGQTSYQACRSVIKVNMHNQTYVWDSDLTYEYRKIKGVTNNLQIVVFGGEKDVSELYYDNKWKRNSFDHKKIIEIDDLQKFSFSKESVFVRAVQEGSEIELNNLDEQLFFGNDVYPCLLFYSKKTGAIRKEPVPLNIRLKSYMGVLQYQKGKYMLIGGSDKTEKKCSRSCFFYNRHNNTGEMGLKMNEKRSRFAYIILNNYLYVFGGFSSSENRALSSCQRYSFALQRWQEMADLKTPKCNALAQIIGKEKIAVIGGEQSHCLTEIQIYNTSKGQFQIFKTRQYIRGEIIFSYLKNTDNLLILRRDENKNYFECQVSLNQEEEVKKESERVINLEKKEEDNLVIVQNSEVQKKVETLAIKSYPNDLESEQSSDLHKIGTPVQSLEPTIIPIQKKKIDEKSNEFMEEEEYEEEDIQMERVAFDDNIVEEIKKSGNFLIEEVIKESIKQHQEEEESELKPSEESEINSPLSPDISRRISEKIEKLKAKSLDNQSKMEDRKPIDKIQSELQKPENKGKPMQWLQNSDFKVIQRGKQVYFVNPSKVIKLQTETVTTEEKYLKEVKFNVFEML